MKKILFVFALFVGTEANAQEGCYIEFSNPGVCSTRLLQMNEWPPTEAELKQKYGVVLGTAFNLIRALDQLWYNAMDGWDTCQDNFKWISDEYNKCYDMTVDYSNRLNRQQRQIKNLRAKVKQLQRKR